MNDFTKEELERMCEFYTIAIEEYHEPDSTYELRDKIQYMIDNYCEHEVCGMCNRANCQECPCR